MYLEINKGVWNIDFGPEKLFSGGNIEQSWTLIGLTITLHNHNIKTIFSATGFTKKKIVFF